MADRVLKGIITWVKKQLFVTRKEGRCVRFVLYHATPNAKVGAEVARVNVGENLAQHEGITDDTAESYAEELYREGESYAEGLGETQTFAIAAYFEADEEKAMARTAFRIDVDSEEITGSLSSEPASLAGLVKQQMRHNEALMRICATSFGTAIGTVQKQNDRLSAMLEKLWDEKVTTIETIEEMATAHHTRKIEAMREEGAQKAKEQLMDSVMALLPAVANKMVGKKILPETTDITLMQVVKLVEALTPAEMEAIIATLPPDKQVTFVEMIKTVQERTSERPSGDGN